MYKCQEDYTGTPSKEDENYTKVRRFTDQMLIINRVMV